MYIDRVAKCGILTSILLVASCSSKEISTGITENALEGPSSLDAPIRPTNPATPPVRPRAAVSPSRVTGAGIVGYYDMSIGFGLGYEVPPITAAGGTAVAIDDPSAANLANLNVLFVTNPDNLGFGFEYVSRLGDIAAAVSSGMVLVIHDRTVTSASTILPSGAGFDIERNFDEGADINIRDASTVVTAGLNNTSLDGGNFSDHGFALDTSLPTRSKLILSSTSNNRIVTFCYPVGTGAVIYSTIPLDFYLQGFGPNPPQGNLANIYAPNVVKYAMAGACNLRGPQPTPN